MIRHVEYIRIRDVWKNETSDFNKWLFEKNNLNYLGSEVGIELMPFKIEKKINKGRIDILAIDKSDDSFVLIENQIGKADHQHYGKIIDYIHSVKPKVTIWIVNEWNSFHKNTIKIIEDLTKLLVVKVDLIRIDKSLIGVKFTTIIEPTNWKRQKTNVIGIFNAEKQHTQNVYNPVAFDFNVHFDVWIENLLSNKLIKTGEWIIKKKLFIIWNEYLNSLNYTNCSSKTFFKLLKSYCLKKNLNFLNRKSGGIEYYKLDNIIHPN